jgi:hypothetical protein
MKTIIAQLHPNNEIRLGWNDLPSKRKNQGDNKPTKDRERLNTQIQESLNEVCDGIGSKYVWDKSTGTLRILTKEQAEQTVRRLDSILDITTKVQREENEKLKTRKPYGVPQRPKRFSRRGRHRLLQGAAIAERWAGGPERTALCTFTLPGGTETAKRLISEWSGYIVNRLLQVIRRCKLVVGWMYAWEWQKRGALHLHVALTTECAESTLALGRALQDRWWEILLTLPHDDAHEVFTAKGGNHCTIRRYWQSDVRLCGRGLANYLSKYISKGASKGKAKETDADGDPLYYPSRFWGMSRWISQEIDAQTVSLSWEDVTRDELALVEAIFDDFLSSSIFLYSYEHLSNIEWVKRRREDGKEEVTERIHLGTVKRRIAYFDSSYRAEALEAFEVLIFLLRDILPRVRISGTTRVFGHIKEGRIERRFPSGVRQPLHPCSNGSHCIHAINERRKLT